MDTPALVVNELIEGSSINVSVVVQQERNVKCLILKITHWYRCDVVKEFIVGT